MRNENDRILVTKDIETAGAVSYWRLSGAVDPARLRAAWVARGLDADLLPALPAPEVALRRAVIELAGKRRLVRPLGKRAAWVVLDESVTADGLDVAHVTVARVKYDNGLAINSAEADPTVYTAAEAAIRANYQRTQNELATDDISHWLIGLANKHNATSLRESGGVYFIPRAGVDFWRAVVGAVEAASDNKIFQIPAVKNSEAVDAILDAVTNEARREIEAINRELEKDGDDALGARALQTRSAAADAMLSKIAAYEALLDTRMTTLRAQIDDLHASLAAAALQDQSQAA